MCLLKNKLNCLQLKSIDIDNKANMYSRSFQRREKEMVLKRLAARYLKNADQLVVISALLRSIKNIENRR